MIEQLLQERFQYDADAGMLRWRADGVGRGRARCKAGDQAGTLKANGYRYVRCAGRQFGAHRAAWFLTYGQFPVGEIDHINGIRDDNRLINLREVTRSENAQNVRKARRGNKCGLLGASWNKKQRAWVAQIRVDGKKISLGGFNSPEDAHAAM
jgi:hypothetical protein